ncbi:hypothetical protein VM1G_07119 [Cytospora mali]|uniref:Uncharacterized protein n=1 Tax=Cytospora mali TaxID=578113 RepID=A0A194W522_CYTMA|nr:hypothetical protein VM1G_07119 [Valsa mali]
MKLPTTTLLVALISSTAANEWTLYCGSSCSDGTAIASGSDYQAASCTNLDSSYEYCYFESDVSWYYAVVYQNADCVVSSDGPEISISPGGCTSAGDSNSYQVALNL